MNASSYVTAQEKALRGAMDLMEYNRIERAFTLAVLFGVYYHVAHQEPISFALTIFWLAEAARRAVSFGWRRLG